LLSLFTLVRRVYPVFVFGFGGKVFWTNTKKQEKKKKFKLRGGLLSDVDLSLEEEANDLDLFPGPCSSGDSAKVVKALQRFVDRKIDSKFNVFF
jgi:hypothetical protein